MRCRIPFAYALLSLAVSTSAARAQQSASPSHAPAARVSQPEEQRQPGAGYGATIVAVDALGAGLVIIGLVGNSTEGVGGGIGAYLLLPPCVHAVNRNYGRAALSVMVRWAVPSLGASIGAQFAGQPRGDSDHDRSTRGALVGALIAMPFAIALDALLITPAPRPVTRGVDPWRTVRLTPTYDAQRATTGLELQGSF